MAKPASRTQLKQYCLRQLGAPVLEVNVADEQIEDLIDDALQDGPGEDQLSVLTQLKTYAPSGFKPEQKGQLGGKPDWFDRDRFVLSAGHGSMLLYAISYLLGYKDQDPHPLGGNDHGSHNIFLLFHLILLYTISFFLLRIYPISIFFNQINQCFDCLVHRNIFFYNCMLFI